ncbi:MAG: hypothetical protein JWQ38_2345 [Flavipsychrobacter sp.]|nr:hypothetical protein [Flavipsychrobacter sp.]
MRIANVIGATGLVGGKLVNQLLHDTRFEKVRVFVRRSTGINNSKLEEHIVDFDAPDKWKKLVTGDVLYSAMGTTLKAAGSKDAQYKIDYTYQYQAAKIAAANNVKEYVLISAAGSSPDSKIFYSKIKGELEQAIQKLPFETIHIIRPGMLSGDRKQVRTGEQLGIGIMNVLSKIPGLGTLRPIKGDEVAKAMINATFRHVSGIYVYNMKDVFGLAERN